MTKLIGSKKIKTAVFISGTGSNLKNLIKFSKNKKSPISIDLILSNTKKAKGLKFADQFNIKMVLVNPMDTDWINMLMMMKPALEKRRDDG